jgi:hypothetical protein
MPEVSGLLFLNSGASVSFKSFRIGPDEAAVAK